MIKLKNILENKDYFIPRFSVGDKIIVIYGPEHSDVEKIYPIVEIRKYTATKNILYIYETSPGHQRAVLEKNIDNNKKVFHSKTGWHT